MRGVAHLHQLMIDAGGTVGLVEMDGGSVADEEGVGGRLTRSRRKAEEQGVGACGIAQRQLEGLHADGFVEQDGLMVNSYNNWELSIDGSACEAPDVFDYDMVNELVEILQGDKVRLEIEMPEIE